MEREPTNTYFGWDTLYRTVEKEIRHNADVLMAVVHWLLTKHSFQCLGIGDDKTLSDVDSANELLPHGWNECESTYQIRYISNGDLYILHGLITEGTLMINLLQSKSCEVSNIALSIDETVKSRAGRIGVMIPEINAVVHRLKAELIDPIYGGSKKDGHTQTAETETPRPCYIDPMAGRAPPMYPNRSDSNLRDPLRIDPLRNIGRGDLDPLGRGGGGMLFNPPGFNPAGPSFPGAPRPGPARFDPFHTPEPGRGQRPNPNNDHFPPPGYDDMFM